MNNFKTALENVMQKDIERFENSEEYEFSAEFEKNMAALSKRASGGARPKKMRIGRIFAATAAAVALFAMGTLAGAVSSGFKITTEKKSEYNFGLPVNIFTAANTENCPQTLETIYAVGDIPEWTKSRRISIHDDNKVVSTLYMASSPADNFKGIFSDGDMVFYRTVNLCQSTKDSFRSSYSAADYVSYKELTVDGRPAYFITRERFYGRESSLIWEGEDYIFELIGNLTEERAVKLAGSLVVFDGEIANNEITGG